MTRSPAPPASNKKAKLVVPFLTFLLITIGLVFISLSSLSEANSTIGDKFFFIKKQLSWLLVGTLSYVVFTKIKLSVIKNLSFPLYIASILTLILVLIPTLGNQALGARRWLDLGIIGIQPSETVKFTSVVYFSYLFSRESKRNIKNLVIYLAIPFFLILLQPNLSTAILISTIVITVYYLAGGEITSLFFLCFFAALLSFLLIFTSDYRSARFKTLFNPQENTSTASYHSNQIILALASGGFFGKGVANSDQKYRYIPKVSTDSILAVIGEETGFIGVGLILFLYLYLVVYLFKLAAKITDPFQSLFVNSTACWIAYQCLINVSAIVAIIPLTGVPLPFISYGGSSLITLLSAIGLVVNIEQNNNKLLYSTSEKNKQGPSHNGNPHNSGNRTDKPTQK
ncbi:MAG: FtsW/RodA/SpoVE family cell cycle protein [Patescibacteria group bacterium]|jgi:cell division protein FtsW